MLHKFNHIILLTTSNTPPNHSEPPRTPHSSDRASNPPPSPPTALTVLVTNVPRQMTEYLSDILSYVWHALTTSAHTYLNTAVNAREEANDPSNSDG